MLDVPATGDPIACQITPTSKPDDLAGANVDVIALQSGTLGVYRELPLTTPGESRRLVCYHPNDQLDPCADE